MKILVVEDEAAIAKSIESKCKLILGSKIETIKVLYSLHRAKEYIIENDIDLCLLDLNLNGFSGFDLLKLVVSFNFHTIIISANTEHALQAFEYGVIDFVPKPFDEHRLRKALERIKLHQEAMKNNTKYISLKKNGKIEVIELSKISHFSADGMYVEAILDDGRTELLNKSMDKLVKILPEHFFRCHRSYIVDLNKMDSFYHDSGGAYKLKLQTGEEVNLSREKYKELKEKFNY